MKKLCVMMIAACVLAVSTANNAEASLLAKRIEGMKKVAALVSNTVKKTADDAAKYVWNNKGSLAIATVATVAISNPEAATAAVTGTADIVTNAVTGTADVAYGVVTNGKTADTAAPRENARPSTNGGSTFSTVLYYLLIIGLVFIVMKYLLRGAVRRLAVPLLIGGVLLCFVSVAEASMLSSIPDIQCAPVLVAKPIMHFVVLVLTVVSIFL